ncbi:MAG: extracellular solute-binding protein, partial [Candidatus Spyradocola sp.]
MKKRGLCLLLALLCALLCACDNQPPAQTAETAASRPQEELVLLSDETELMEVCMRAAQEKYGVRVTLADTGNDAYEQMLLDFAAGRATYDVVCVSNALGDLYTADGLIDRGYFAPLSGCGQVEESVSHMLPVLQDCVTRDGVIYALPCAMRTKVLTYNRPLYDAKVDGSTERYYARTGENVTSTWLQQIPEMREFSAWNELFVEMPLRDGVL